MARESGYNLGESKGGEVLHRLHDERGAVSKQQAREAYRLEHDPWYVKLEGLFEQHQQAKLGEEFILPEDCPPDVGEYFINKMLRVASEQGVMASSVHEEAEIPEAMGAAAAQELGQGELVEELESSVPKEEPKARKTKKIFDSTNPAHLDTKQVVSIRFGPAGLRAKPVFKEKAPADTSKSMAPVEKQAVEEKFKSLEMELTPEEKAPTEVKVESIESELSPEEKSAQEWLVDKLGLKPGEVYGDLRGARRDEADKKFAQAAESLWRHFMDQKKWLFDNSGRHLEIEEKQLGDVEAKVLLGFIKQAGLDRYVNKHSFTKAAQAKESGSAISEPGWANVLDSQQFAGFDKGLESSDRATAAEIMYRLLTAGKVLNKDDEAYWAAGNIAHKTVYNDIVTTRDQLQDSPQTLRGMSRFLSYGTLCAYIREHWSRLTATTNEGKLEELLDREITPAEAEKYDLVRKVKKKATRDCMEEQLNLVAEAEKILAKDEASLQQEGHIAESNEWGKLFINIATSKDEQFPGGAMAVKAWGSYDGYLQIDKENNSYLFRSFKPLDPAKANKLNLPGGQWAYNMYFKARGSQGSEIKSDEVLKALGVVREPEIKVEPTVTIETAPVNLERDEEIEKQVEALRINVQQVWWRKISDPKIQERLQGLTPEQRQEWLDKAVEATLELRRKQLYDKKAESKK